MPVKPLDDAACECTGLGLFGGQPTIKLGNGGPLVEKHLPILGGPIPAALHDPPDVFSVVVASVSPGVAARRCSHHGGWDGRAKCKFSYRACYTCYVCYACRCVGVNRSKRSKCSRADYDFWHFEAAVVGSGTVMKG